MLFVANWKMNMLPQQSVEWCVKNREELTTLAKPEGIEIVLCPAYSALGQVHQQIHTISGVDLGAQDCSAYKEGSFTGEISASMLGELGCAYCIVGHSERRSFFAETNEIIAQKVARLLESAIVPIICIGESHEEFENQQTIKVLRNQLEPVLAVIKTHKPFKVVFAYEPVWSIGTGKIPEKNHLEEVFSFLEGAWQNLPPQAGALMLYGGSVSEENAKSLAQIKGIQGFLIGGASLNFSKFKNIVGLAR